MIQKRDKTFWLGWFIGRRETELAGEIKSTSSSFLLGILKRNTRKLSNVWMRGGSTKCIIPCLLSCGYAKLSGDACREQPAWVDENCVEMMGGDG